VGRCETWLAAEEAQEDAATHRDVFSSDRRDRQAHLRVTRHSELFLELQGYMADVAVGVEVDACNEVWGRRVGTVHGRRVYLIPI